MKTLKTELWNIKTDHFAKTLHGKFGQLILRNFDRVIDTSMGTVSALIDVVVAEPLQRKLVPVSIHLAARGNVPAHLRHGRD